MAIYALSINPTTGPAERNWLTHSFIQNKSCNRLSNDKVEKLVFLFSNLRIRDQIDSSSPAYFADDEVEQNDHDEIDDIKGDEEVDITPILEGFEIAGQVDELIN